MKLSNGLFNLGASILHVIIIIFMLGARKFCGCVILCYFVKILYII